MERVTRETDGKGDGVNNAVQRIGKTKGVNG